MNTKKQLERTKQKVKFYHKNKNKNVKRHLKNLVEITNELMEFTEMKNFKSNLQKIRKTKSNAEILEVYYLHNFETDNLLFDSFDNRDIEITHLQSLIKNIAEDGDISPLTVIEINIDDETFYYLKDGQHRAIVYYLLGYNIPIIRKNIKNMNNKYSIEDQIERINTDQQGWTPTTHIKQSIKKGQSFYIQYENLKNNKLAGVPSESVLSFMTNTYISEPKSFIMKYRNDYNKLCEDFNIKNGYNTNDKTIKEMRDRYKETEKKYLKEISKITQRKANHLFKGFTQFMFSLNNWILIERYLQYLIKQKKKYGNNMYPIDKGIPQDKSDWCEFFKNSYDEFNEKS